jgi:hypothetical protein
MNRKRCHGQAMAEFAVAVGVLVTLLLCMPVLGRYHELQMASIQAARRAAFEGSWRASPSGNTDPGSIRNALFPDVGDSAQIIAERLRVHVTTSGEPGVAGSSTRALLAPFGLTRAIGAGFDLHEPVMYTASVTVALSRPPQLPDPFAQTPIEFNERYVLAGGDWASSGPGQVESRAGGLVPTRATTALRPLLKLTTTLLSVLEPSLRELCLGQVDPEHVPGDRLGAGADPDAVPVTRWSLTC